MKLSGPVQVEVYPDHEDFAVRTMGMPGLGALGVTFGQVVAMDSPSARKPGDFNWGSTLWHEMSHVYILSATNGRVPRWFTEGLAVHEETQVSPEWGDHMSPDILVAIRDKKLLPVAKLDRGFIFPEYPAQVVVSYFEAGQHLRLHPGATGAKASCSTWSIPMRRARPLRKSFRRILASHRRRSISNILRG